MKCLLLTNLMFGWSGSETIIYEWGENLVGAGHQVTILCNQLDRKFTRPLEKLGVLVVDDPARVTLSDFDFCYCQHQLINLVIEREFNRQHQQFPYICYAHLSPYEGLEFPGPITESLLADVILANSQETYDALGQMGMDTDLLSLFPNPAPIGFFEVTKFPDKLSRVLVVSNHLPDEMDAALDILSGRGIDVVRVGEKFGQKRILPADIERADAVVSIGKTVQYALAAKRPVYCYDRFGGPGWIVNENYQFSADNNFSGRPECTRKSAKEISEEILSEFAVACQFSKNFDAREAGFSLEAHVSRLLTVAKENTGNLTRLKKVNRVLNTPEMTLSVAREANFSKLLRQEKKHAYDLGKIRERLEIELGYLENSKLPWLRRLSAIFRPR